MMKIAQVALVSALVGLADSMPLSGLFKFYNADAGVDVDAEAAAMVEEEPTAAVGHVEEFANPSDEQHRELQTGCYGSEGRIQEKWHPQYHAGWTNGYCRFTRDCDSPGYSTQLACCKGAYSGQTSGYCLQQLPEPPTTSPTGEAETEFYPDYNTAWPEAGCITKRPIPSGRPVYDTMLACCKGAYGGQVSGKCLAGLPTPPTSSPTSSDFAADFWYPDYDTAWSIAGCSNKLPLPYKYKTDRPNYDTHLACCKAAYAGQMSGKCLAGLENPPTMSPTDAGGFDYYYPDYETAWSEATCKNTRPLPFNPGDRPTYDTMLACCKGAYGGQVSGKCLAALPNPPTTSPTESGGVDYWYPDYETSWSIAICKNTRPLPFSPGDRPTYDSYIACCKGAYAGQVSGKCLAGSPTPPTTSPTSSGGLDVYYKDPSAPWSTAKCTNDSPLPNNAGPTFTSKTACCSNVGYQPEHSCFCDADPCYSCKCSASVRTANGCTLDCD